MLQNVNMFITKLTMTKPNFKSNDPNIQMFVVYYI